MPEHLVPGTEELRVLHGQEGGDHPYNITENTSFEVNLWKMPGIVIGRLKFRLKRLD
jgi:hypothetical protein